MCWHIFHVRCCSCLVLTAVKVVHPRATARQHTTCTCSQLCLCHNISMISPDAHSAHPLCPLQVNTKIWQPHPTPADHITPVRATARRRRRRSSRRQYIICTVCCSCHGRSRLSRRSSSSPTPPRPLQQWQQQQKQQQAAVHHPCGLLLMPWLWARPPRQQQRPQAQPSRPPPPWRARP